MINCNECPKTYIREIRTKKYNIRCSQWIPYCKEANVPLLEGWHVIKNAYRSAFFPPDNYCPPWCPLMCREEEE